MIEPSVESDVEAGGELGSEAGGGSGAACGIGGRAIGSGPSRSAVVVVVTAAVGPFGASEGSMRT